MKNWLIRRPAAAGLLVAVTLLVGTGSIGAWQFYQHASTSRARQAQTDREVSGILDRARFKLDEGWQTADLVTLKEAQADASRAADVARSGGASPAMRTEVEALEVETAEQLTHARKNHSLLNALLDVSASNEVSPNVRFDEGRVRGLAQPSIDEQYAAAFRAWGLDMDGASEAEAAARLSAEPAVVGQEIVAALDNWILERRRQQRPMVEWRRLVRISERLDASDQHRRLRAWLIEDAPSRAASMAVFVSSAWSPFTALLDLEAANNRRQLLELQAKIDPRTEPALTVALLAQAFAAAGDVPRAEQMLMQAVTARPDQVVLLDHLGKLLLRQGTPRLGEAIAYLQAARGQRPQLGLALSKALVLAGRAAQAEEVSQELVRQQPDKSAGWFSLGSALAAQKKYAAAETANRKAIELDPDFAEAHFNLGVVLNAQQKYADAEAAYRKAVALKPNFAEAQTNLGGALHRRKQDEEAEATIRKAIEINPDLAIAHGLLGNVLAGRKSYGDAERAFRKAIELEPHFAEAHSNLANVLLYMRNYGEAEAASRKAIELAPDLAEAHSNLGDALVEQRRFIEAEPILRKSIDLSAKNPWTYLRLGVALMGQARFVDAEAAFRKAIEIKPDLAEAHHDLGSALVSQRKFGEGEAAYRKAIEFKPDLADAYYHLGKIFMRSLWKLGSAESHFRKAIELNPNYADAYFNLGVVLEIRLKLDDAEAAYRKAAELNPRFLAAQLKVKTALFRKGKFGEAEALCRNVIELRPDFAEAYCDLGRALSAQEKYGLSQAAWQKAIELKPGDAEANLHFGIALTQQGKIRGGRGGPSQNDWS